jgi:hypothetical protein
MKKIKQTILILLSIWIALFLLSAFVAWSANPGHWDELGRVLFALVLTAVSVPIICERHKSSTNQSNQNP